MKSKPSLAVLLIHDQRAGHLNPSLGVYDCLETAYATTLKNAETPDIKKWQISLLKKLTWYPYLFDLCSRILFNDLSLKQNIDCIICSGMPNLLYGLAISRKLKVPIFYAGDLRKVNGQLVNCTITALEQKTDSDQVVLTTPPVKKDFFTLQYDQLDQTTALLVLGGPTDEHPFSTEDFEKMIKKFIAFCAQNQLKGLITNSRRTPNLEGYFQKTSIPSNIQLHLVQTENALSLVQLIQQSSYIFVTEDSTSMLAETIQSGRFVSSIYSPKSILEPLNKKYIEAQLMQRQKLEEIFQYPSIRNTQDLNSSTPITQAFKRNLGY
ncbi:ELM1/GtrOC1 family putative glycosyltransferase [Acinetobacter sp. YH12096]|uniref:ELM1/GtrOC1 family putative glycosyltransferase n=1 Tax=Acinetobacter sp. YH12096 TaxID=2601085 RepID=UPI0015D35B89|nr:ELM1/GtrOC1 family putative glycosyltransferase [Acinetobacter sp. YH12096]